MCNNNGMCGCGGNWWWIIILLLIFCNCGSCGNNGGYYNGNSCGCDRCDNNCGCC